MLRTLGQKIEKKNYAKSIQNALKRMQNKYERNPMKNEVARAIWSLLLPYVTAKHLAAKRSFIFEKTSFLAKLSLKSKKMR